MAPEVSSRTLLSELQAPQPIPIPAPIPNLSTGLPPDTPPAQHVADGVCGHHGSDAQAGSQQRRQRRLACRGEIEQTGGYAAGKRLMLALLLGDASRACGAAIKPVCTPVSQRQLTGAAGPTQQDCHGGALLAQGAGHMQVLQGEGRRCKR